MNIVFPLATKPFLPKIAEAFFSNEGEKHNLFELIDWGTLSGIYPSPGNLAPLFSYHLPLKLDSGV